MWIDRDQNNTLMKQIKKIHFFKRGKKKRHRKTKMGKEKKQEEKRQVRKSAKNKNFKIIKIPKKSEVSFTSS